MSVCVGGEGVGRRDESECASVCVHACVRACVRMCMRAYVYAVSLFYGDTDGSPTACEHVKLCTQTFLNMYIYMT